MYNHAMNRKREIVRFQRSVNHVGDNRAAVKSMDSMCYTYHSHCVLIGPHNFSSWIRGRGWGWGDKPKGMLKRKRKKPDLAY